MSASMPGLYIQFDPTQITHYFVVRNPLEKFRFAASSAFLPKLVRRGRWDLRVDHVEEHPTYRLIAGLKDAGFDPERWRPVVIAYYQERGHSLISARAKTDQKLPELLTRYTHLFHNMDEHGYQAGLAPDEIGIAIARDGSFLKASGGHHRFAVARILGLQMATAEVRCVHVDWFRAAQRRSGISRPSLAEILDYERTSDVSC